MVKSRVVLSRGGWAGARRFEGRQPAEATNSRQQRVGVRAPKDPLLFNDPSAGSPTETLLRLLLPLNDQV